jgi:hypothetical protein
LAYGRKVRLRRIFLLLAAGALAGNLAVACDSAEDVGVGGTCFLLTDCAEGLFCHRPEGGVSGTCEGKGELGTIQPAGDATLADAGPMPEPDAAPGDAAPPPAEDSATGEDAPAAQADAQTADRTAPVDSSGGGKPDTSTPDTSAPDTSVPDTSVPADTGSADTSSSPGD